MSAQPSGLPADYDFAVWRGDSWSQAFILQRLGNPVDLTGATVTAYARPKHQTGTPSALSANITGAATGGKVTIGPGASPLAVGLYDYDVQVVLAGVTTTWVKGDLRVLQDVSP